MLILVLFLFYVLYFYQLKEVDLLSSVRNNSIYDTYTVFMAQYKKL